MENSGYQVLARKYRPGNFAELRGQDGLVRTVQNSIRLGRVAHAFMLTGVRGVGKTTTARIIAKALNCDSSSDGKAVIEPCNDCDSCRAIAEDRHLDVQEIDAASHNSIDDMRDIGERAGYKPAMGRCRVYILDEVHMLSKQAFNGLLKTLEEPPPHVIFILATTDVNKVPITILSRCQRFDLLRVKGEVLESHFRFVCDKEGVKVSDSALHLIVQNAEGSVRDGLSLLEQALAVSAGDIDVAQVREMLGLSDRGLLLDLFDMLLQGDVVSALAKLGELDALGADSLQIVKDSLDLTYRLTQMCLVAGGDDDQSLPEAERMRCRSMADKLSVGQLSRIWQVLFKGLSEVKIADNPRQTLDMLLVRIMYLHQTPTPDELIKALEAGVPVATPSESSSSESSEPAKPFVPSQTSLEGKSFPPSQPVLANEPPPVEKESPPANEPSEPPPESSESPAKDSDNLKEQAENDSVVKETKRFFSEATVEDVKILDKSS